MSRIGKQPINVPEKTSVSVANGVVTVTGPLGTLSRTFKQSINVVAEDSVVTLSPAEENNFTKALWGTYASHIANMVHGVNFLYEKKLVVEGVGYKTESTGKTLTMQLGFSHPVVLDVPEGITVVVEKNVITISGIDKELVGHFAALVRSKRKPEPYKGKGIRYENEVVRRKQGKKAV